MHLNKISMLITLNSQIYLFQTPSIMTSSSTSSSHQLKPCITCKKLFDRRGISSHERKCGTGICGIGYPFIFVIILFLFLLVQNDYLFTICGFANRCISALSEVAMGVVSFFAMLCRGVKIVISEYSTRENKDSFDLPGFIAGKIAVLWTHLFCTAT